MCVWGCALAGGWRSGVRGGGCVVVGVWRGGVRCCVGSGRGVMYLGLLIASAYVVGPAFVLLGAACTAVEGKVGGVSGGFV